MITAVFKILNCGLTLTSYAFADHHTENLQIFEVNAWVNLDLYGTLVRGAKNGWTDCSTPLLVLDAEMDRSRGTVLHCKSSSRTSSGPLQAYLAKPLT